MGKFDGILICTDLDGTLFDDKKQVSKENLDAISYFKSEGGIFTFVTGRMPYFVSNVARIVEPNAPFGCINGGGLYDFETGTYLWTRGLPDSVLELISYIAAEMPHMGIQLNCFEKLFFLQDNEAMAQFRLATGVPDLSCTLQDELPPIAKIVFGDMEEREIDRLAHLLANHPRADEFTFIRSEETLYEILPQGSGKEVALGKLTEHLRIPVSHTFAIGDYNNDVGMLRAAGVGVAVANACPAALAAADYVATDNNHHAIAHLIGEIEAGRWAL